MALSLTNLWQNYSPSLYPVCNGSYCKWICWRAARGACPIFLNDHIKARSKLKALIEKKSRFSNRVIQQIYETSFYNQDDELIAIADSWCFRTERSTAKKKGKYREIQIQNYTPEEIQAIIEDYEKEEVRGLRRSIGKM